jgi:hypothetical protein
MNGRFAPQAVTQKSAPPSFGSPNKVNTLSRKFFSATGRVTVALRRQRVTRSNRVGCASFSFFYSAICAPGPRLQLCLIRASKQSGGKSWPNADSLATDDVGWKLACLRTATVSTNDRIRARRPPLTPIRAGNTATLLIGLGSDADRRARLLIYQARGSILNA